MKKYEQEKMLREEKEREEYEHNLIGRVLVFVVARLEIRFYFFIQPVNVNLSPNHLNPLLS